MRAHSIRPAGPEEHDLIVQFVRAYYQEDGIPFDSGRVIPAVQLLLESGAFGGCWILETEGRPIGYAMATKGFDIEFGGILAVLTDLYVEPDARGLGCGAALLARVEHEATSWGAQAIELTPERHNAAARVFYERSGFRHLDRTAMWKPLP